MHSVTLHQLGCPHMLLLLLCNEDLPVHHTEQLPLHACPSHLLPKPQASALLCDAMTQIFRCAGSITGKLRRLKLHEGHDRQCEARRAQPDPQGRGWQAALQVRAAVHSACVYPSAHISTLYSAGACNGIDLYTVFTLVLWQHTLLHLYLMGGSCLIWLHLQSVLSPSFAVQRHQAPLPLLPARALGQAARAERASNGQRRRPAKHHHSVHAQQPPEVEAQPCGHL